MSKGSLNLSTTVVYFIVLLFLAGLVIGGVRFYYGEKFIEAQRTSLTLQHIFLVDHVIHRCFADEYGLFDPLRVTPEILTACVPEPALRVTLDTLTTAQPPLEVSTFPDDFPFDPSFVREELVRQTDGSLALLLVEVHGA